MKTKANEFWMQRRIYYADTDAAGIVYHPNYLKFCEQARTDILYDHDLCPFSLAKLGRSFVVTQCHLEFKKPARLGDQLDITSTIEKLTQTRCYWKHHIQKDNELLCDVQLLTVCVNQTMQATRFPKIILEKLPYAF